MVFFRSGSVAVTTVLALHAQIAITGVATTATQAILQYTSPVAGACSVQVADMNRAIAITSGTQAAGLVTLQTKAPHGLLAGAVVYIENTGVQGWDGWQTIVSVPATSSFIFSSAAAGSKRSRSGFDSSSSHVTGMETYGRSFARRE